MKPLLPSNIVIVCLGILLLTACGPTSTATPAAVLPTATPTVTTPVTPTLTPTPTPTASPTPTVTPTPTATPIATPIPYVSIPLPEGNPQEQANHVLSLLEQNGYGDLVYHLRVLPEISDGIDSEDVEALADIAALAVTATDPEVGEAYDLMIKNGTLDVLWHMARRREFKPNDTLVQAIALVAALPIELGDNLTRELVYQYAIEYLDLGREIGDWQRSEGLGYSLEHYPLSGKIAWAWPGNETPVFGPNRFVDYYLSGQKMDPVSYESNVAIPSELESMRSWMGEKELIRPTANEAIAALEEYLWFDSTGGLVFPHWKYAPTSGPRAPNHDAGSHLANLERTGRSRGGRNAEYTVVDLGLKAVGIPSIAIFSNVYGDSGFLEGHIHSIYYDPGSGRWKAYPHQLVEGNGNRPMDETVRLFVMRPPITYASAYFYEEHDKLDTRFSGHHFIIPEIMMSDLIDMFRNGVPDDQLKGWLLQ